MEETLQKELPRSYLQLDAFSERTDKDTNSRGKAEDKQVHVRTLYAQCESKKVSPPIPVFAPTSLLVSLPRVFDHCTLAPVDLVSSGRCPIPDESPCRPQSQFSVTKRHQSPETKKKCTHPMITKHCAHTINNHVGLLYWVDKQKNGLDYLQSSLPKNACIPAQRR